MQNSVSPARTTCRPGVPLPGVADGVGVFVGPVGVGVGVKVGPIGVFVGVKVGPTGVFVGVGVEEGVTTAAATVTTPFCVVLGICVPLASLRMTPAGAAGVPRNVIGDGPAALPLKLIMASVPLPLTAGRLI